MRSFRPWRTTTWSSASRMRRRPLISGMVVNGHWRRRHANEDRRPLAWSGFDLQRRADERGALLHSQQTESASGGLHRCRIESHAIVFDDEGDVVGSTLED